MTPEEFHARIWEILAPVDIKDFEVVAASAPGPEAIAALEAATGFPIPEPFGAFSRKTNGLCVIARDEVWPPAEQFAVGPAWTFWRGVVLLGIDAPDLPDWASMSARQSSLAEDGRGDFLPVLKIVGDGSRVWGYDRTGAIAEICDFEAPTPLSGDLLDLYADQIGALIKRQRDMAERIAGRS